MANGAMKLLLLETFSTAPSLVELLLHFQLRGVPLHTFFFCFCFLSLPKWAFQPVFCSFQAPDETTLKLLAEMLQQKNIDHKLWMEQPENIPTCIALRPYPKEEVSQYLKKFRLFK